MVFLLSDVFLLLTQVLLWIVVGLIVWFVLLRVLPRAFLGMLVLLLILALLALSFVQGPPVDGGILETLWRIIAFPFTPLGLAIILLSILLSSPKGLSKAGRNALLISLIILALGSIPIVSYTLAQELETESIELIRPIPALPAGARRVIVVMADDTTRAQLQPLREPPPQPVPRVDRPISANALQVLSQLPVQLTERGDVLTYTSRLYQQEAGNNPLIVVSAGPRRDRSRRDGESSQDSTEARDAQRYLTEVLGVPATNIAVDTGGTSARRSAESVRKLLTDQGINFGNQIVLVDSALSMNRSALAYANVFSDSAIYARPADFYTLPPTDRLRAQVRDRDLTRRPIQVTDLIPSADSFCLGSKVFQEYMTSLYYFLRGWIRPLQPALT